MNAKDLVKHPDTDQKCKRIFVGSNVAHSGPAWDWCEATRKYINDNKPKYIRDDKNKIRKRYPKGGV